MKKGMMFVIAFTIGATLVACNKSETDVSECNQVFKKADKYIGSLPEEQKQIFKMQMESLKKLTQENKTEAKNLCQATLDQIEK